MRPIRIAAWTSLALAVTATAFAGPVTIWAVDPATDLIFRIDPGTGGAKGAVPTPVPPDAATDRFVGLTGADGGRRLLYQLGSPPFFDPLRETVFEIDTASGAIVGTFSIDRAPGPSGLSWAEQSGDEFLYWVHTSGDVHRFTNPRGPAPVDEFDWGPFGPDGDAAPAGGLGGDDTHRQFGLYCELAGQGGPDDCRNLPLFIGEFDAFQDVNSFIRAYPAPASDTIGLAFVAGTLYASTVSGFLYSLDPDTGDTLDVVKMPFDFAPYDIAATVPEPSLLALFGCAAAVAARRWRTGRARHASPTRAPFSRRR